MGLAELIKESVGGTAAFHDGSPVGANVKGVVISAIVRQVRKYQPPGATGPIVLDVWDDGAPKQQIVVTLRTTERDPQDPEDDGVRSVYIKWWGLSRAALLQALSAAKAEDILPDGQFYAEYMGLGEKKPGLNPPKIFRYAYQPPSGTAGLFQQQETARRVEQPVLSGFTVPPERAPGGMVGPTDPWNEPTAPATNGHAPAAAVADPPAQPWATPSSLNAGKLGAQAPTAGPGDMVAIVAQIRELNRLGVPLQTISAMSGQPADLVTALLSAPAS